MNKVVLISMAMDVLFFVLGLVFWKVKIPQNSFIGIRTSKTLTNEVLWNSANKRAGAQIVNFSIVAFAVTLILVMLGFELDSFSIPIFVFTNIAILAPLGETLFWLKKQ